MDWLEDEHPPTAAHEARDVPHRALERRAVAAGDRKAAEDDGVVERARARRVEPGDDVALLEAHEPRRHERARLVARGLHRGLREVEPRDVPGAALLGEPPRDPPGAAAHVGDPATGHVAQGAHDERALALVPQDVERVGGPERARHSVPGGGARVPVRGDAVHRVAREPLSQELPDAGRPGSVGVLRRLRHAVASSHDSSPVSMETRASASSARAVASARVAPWASA